MGLLPAAAASLPADVQRPLYVLPPLFPQTRSVVRRRILELGEPGIIVRDADGEVRGTLFEEARHALGGIGAAPAREDRAAVPAVRAHWVRRAEHPPEHVAGERDRHRRDRKSTRLNSSH